MIYVYLAELVGISHGHRWVRLRGGNAIVESDSTVVNDTKESDSVVLMPLRSLTQRSSMIPQSFLHLLNAHVFPQNQNHIQKSLYTDPLTIVKLSKAKHF